MSGEITRHLRRFATATMFAAVLSAQGPPPFGGPPRLMDGPDRPRGRGMPPGRALHVPYGGKWWTDPAIVQRLNLTPEQQRKLEDTFQQNRLKLIDLTAALEKQEAILDPLLAAEHPQEAAVLAQIDRVAEARAALEKANSRMLFAFRMILTAEQWAALQNQSDPHFPHPMERPGPGR